MNRNRVLASTLALLLTGSMGLALAQSAPTSSSAVPTTTTQTKVPRAGHNPMMMQRQHWQHAGKHDRGGVIGNLRALEKLYMASGRSKALVEVYNDVLARSQNPRTRDYVYRRLAQLQSAPANVDQAAATLRKALDESLSNEAKMRTQREQMRGQWQQRHAPQPATATPPAG